MSLLLLKTGMILAALTVGAGVAMAEGGPTLEAPATASDRVITLPDVWEDGCYVMKDGTLTKAECGDPQAKAQVEQLRAAAASFQKQLGECALQRAMEAAQ